MRVLEAEVTACDEGPEGADTNVAYGAGGAEDGLAVCDDSVPHVDCERESGQIKCSYCGHFLQLSINSWME